MIVRLKTCQHKQHQYAFFYALTHSRSFLHNIRLCSCESSSASAEALFQFSSPYLDQYFENTQMCSRSAYFYKGRTQHRLNKRENKSVIWLKDRRWLGFYFRIKSCLSFKNKKEAGGGQLPVCERQW